MPWYCCFPKKQEGGKGGKGGRGVVVIFFSVPNFAKK